MKRILAWIVAIALFCPFGLSNANGDPIAVPAYPPLPKRAWETVHGHSAYPAYAIAAGAVALTLTGSLVGLRVIRKRNGNGRS